MNIETLQRLAACRSPIVGIPRPGQYAFAIVRRRLALLIRGMENARISIVEGTTQPFTCSHPPEQPVTGEMLMIVSEDGKRSYGLFDAFHSLNRFQAQKERIKACSALKRQAEAKVHKIPHQAPSWLAEELRQAEKRLSGVWKSQAERQNLFAWLHPDSEGLPDRLREAAQAYYAAATQRKQLAAIAAGYFARQYGLKEVYKQVRHAGFKLKPLSQQCTHVREQGEVKYVKSLAAHCMVDCNPFSRWSVSDRDLSLCRKHNEQWRNWRLASERVQYIRAQVQACAEGQDVVLERTFED